MATTTPQPPINYPEVPAARLDSWKEIAGYLKRDERTVRRWEAEGLPVHRRVHKKQASIFAYTNEIDAWWNEGRRNLELAKRPIPPKGQRLILKALAGSMLVGVLILTVLYVARSRDHFRTNAASVSHIKSLAVLPLENLSNDSAQEYFADGIPRS